MSPEHETVLVIEDEPAIREGLEMNLRAEGYRVLTAGDSPTGLKLCLKRQPDLVLLDLMLPGGSGLDLLAALRKEGSEVPVLILTALSEEEDIVKGLKLGADDYVTKPFRVAELLARVGAALRRAQVAKAAEPARVRVRVGRLEVEPESGKAWQDGQELKLTRREQQLLLTLARHPGRVYGRDQILRLCWGDEYEGTSRTVDNFVCSLRAKVEEDPGKPRHLVTVRGLGDGQELCRFREVRAQWTRLEQVAGRVDYVDGSLGAGTSFWI